MALKYSTTARNNRATQLNTDIGANARLKWVTGTRPANVGAALTGTVVATFICNASGFGTVSGGALTAAAIANVTASAAGTVTHWRLEKADGTAVMDGDIATSGSDLNVDNPVINSGQTCTMPSWVLTMAGA